jgi:hypothetical protein
MFVSATVRRSDDDRGVLLGFVDVLRQVEVRGDRDPEPVLVRHRLTRDVVVEIEDVVVGQGHGLLLSRGLPAQGSTASRDLRTL